MKRSLPPLILFLLIVAPAVARADGLPLPVDASPDGVVSENGQIRYLTAHARGRTAVISQYTSGGAIAAAEMLRGQFTVPVVSYDGTADGLSADGRSLVLIRPRLGFPRRRTTLALLDAHRRGERLRLRRLVRLAGDFSFDALSPDGKALFLINYVSGKDPTRYRVRVYDLATGRLAPKPIVDPREEPDEMNGLPVSRLTSADGRWAYTLYDGTEGHPFIHALDTVARKARCIDLDDVHIDPFNLRLTDGASSGEIAVVRGRRPLAVVDTSTFEVRAPDEDRAPGERPSRSGTIVWPLPLALVAVLGVGLVAVRVRARADRAR